MSCTKLCKQACPSGWAVLTHWLLDCLHSFWKLLLGPIAEHSSIAVPEICQKMACPMLHLCAATNTQILHGKNTSCIMIWCVNMQFAMAGEHATCIKTYM